MFLEGKNERRRRMEESRVGSPRNQEAVVTTSGSGGTIYHRETEPALGLRPVISTPPTITD